MVVEVIIDSREQESGFFLAALLEAGIYAQVQMLPVGDFLIFGKDSSKDATLIERKAASDFLSSLEGSKDKNTGLWEKGRLWDQLRRMKESEVEDRRLIIEGNVTRRLTAYRKKGFTKFRLWGAHHGIYNWNTEIVRTKNKDETAEYIVHLAQGKDKPKKEFALRASPNKSMTLSERRLYLLQGLPSVGPKTSRKIMKEHKTIRNFLKNIDTSKSIGEKAKKEIKKIFG